MMLSLDTIVKRGYLTHDELESHPKFPREFVDFGPLIQWKLPLLRKAAENFRRSTDTVEQAAYQAFCQRHASWLEEFVMFMALKEVHDYVMWTLWEPEVALREPEVLDKARRALHDRIETNKFIQF